MKFSRFYEFLLLENQFILFKIDFISAQVTWSNLERVIARLIMTVDLHLKAGVHGTISFVDELF